MRVSGCECLWGGGDNPEYLMKVKLELKPTKACKLNTVKNFHLRNNRLIKICVDWILTQKRKKNRNF